MWLNIHGYIYGKNVDNEKLRVRYIWNITVFLTTVVIGDKYIY